MANIYKSNYTGAKVDEAIRKVLNAAPEASDELQKKLKQVINLANYDFSTVTSGTIKGITDLNADLAKLPKGSIIQFSGELPYNAVNSSNKIVFKNQSTIIGLRYVNTTSSQYNLIFDNTTGNHLTFIQCDFNNGGGSADTITRIVNAYKYHFIDCVFNGGITAGVYIDQNSINNNLLFDHCIFTCSTMPQSDIPGCIIINNCYNVTFNNCEISNNRGGTNGGYTDYCFYNMNSFGNWYINTCYNSVTGKPISKSDVNLINNGIISPSLPEPVSYVSTLPTANDSSPSLVFLME